MYTVLIEAYTPNVMTERELPPKNNFSRNRLIELGLSTFERRRVDLFPSAEKDFKNGRWSKIANDMRNYSLDVQQALARDFFGREGANFPNGEELAEFLVRINNIKWFARPDTSEGSYIEKLQKKVNQLTRDLNLGNKQMQIIWGDWERTHIPGINEQIDERIDAMKVPVFDALKKSGRWQVASVAMDAAEGCVNVAIHTGWKLTRDISGRAWGAARSMAANASIYAKFAVINIMAHDVLVSNRRRTVAFLKSNPVKAAFDIYELGAVPIGLDNERFVVFRP